MLGSGVASRALCLVSLWGGGTGCALSHRLDPDAGDAAPGTDAAILVDGAAVDAAQRDAGFSDCELVAPAPAPVEVTDCCAADDPVLIARGRSGPPTVTADADGWIVAWLNRGVSAARVTTDGAVGPLVNYSALGGQRGATATSGRCTAATVGDAIALFDPPPSDGVLTWFRFGERNTRYRAVDWSPVLGGWLVSGIEGRGVRLFARTLLGRGVASIDVWRGDQVPGVHGVVSVPDGAVVLHGAGATLRAHVVQLSAGGELTPRGPPAETAFRPRTPDAALAVRALGDGRIAAAVFDGLAARVAIFDPAAMAFTRSFPAPDNERARGAPGLAPVPEAGDVFGICVPWRGDVGGPHDGGHGVSFAVFRADGSIIGEPVVVAQDIRFPACGVAWHGDAFLVAWPQAGAESLGFRLVRPELRPAD